MAERAALIDLCGDGSVLVVHWSGLQNGDTGQAIQMAEWADRSIHVVGAFGTGGTLLFEGSNYGSNYASLNDGFGTTISFTAAGLKSVAEISLYVRPRVSAGNAQTLLDVHMLVRRGSGVSRVVREVSSVAV